jgi:hypothetical protein
VEIKKLKLNPHRQIIRKISMGLLVGVSLGMLTACGGGKKTNPLMENMTPITPEIRPEVPSPHDLPQGP